jgi:hypothetical protein
MPVRHSLLSVTCVLALLSACASTSSDMQVSSARYSVPKTLDDLANRASIVVRGTLLTEPTIEEIQMTAAKPGERQTESLWAFEISQIRVTDIVASRPGTEPRPAVGDTITIGVAIVNPAVGHSIKTIEPDLLVDYPAAGASLTGRVQQVGLFLLSGLRDLGAPDTRGFEVASYRASTDVTAATPLVAVAGPLRGTTPTEDRPRGCVSAQLQAMKTPIGLDGVAISGDFADEHDCFAGAGGLWISIGDDDKEPCA